MQNVRRRKVQRDGLLLFPAGKSVLKRSGRLSILVKKNRRITGRGTGFR